MITELDPEASSRGGENEIFICFASFEERCKGAASRLKDYKANKCYILHITDEVCEKREQAVVELGKILSEFGEVCVVDTMHSDPVVGLLALSQEVQAVCDYSEPISVTIDISTFPRKQLLLMLRLLEELHLMNSTRILYTEPGKYLADMDMPLSFGIKEIGIIPTFKGNYDPHKELKLILFLGYDGDRALALLENIEPHKTIIVIPKPAFYPEWEGKTEKLNGAVLAAVDDKCVHYSHSQDPDSTVDLLKRLIKPENEDVPDNWYIAPLGTKLQALGVYYFTSKWPDVASVVHASALKHNDEKFSEGIGKTLIF